MRFILDVDKKHSSLILGITLRYARLKAGLSLRDMAELAKISHTLIANIEHGKTVANQATLRDMFSLLKIQYRDDDQLIDEFQTIHDRVFNHLYQFHYDRVVDDITYLEEHEAMYMNSIVIIDYALLRFLYAVLTEHMTPYLEDSLDLVKRVSDLFSPKQQQLKHLIVGVHLYQQGRYKESYHELDLARNTGDSRLDPLINLFIIRANVRMFMFMDAQLTAEKTIKQFEEQLNYQRAMQVRLELAYSHISLKKYKDALRYIDYVEHYGTEYQHTKLLRSCQDNRLSLYMMKLEFDTVESILATIKEETVVSLIARIITAAMKGDVTGMKVVYDQYLQLYENRPKLREHQFVTGLMYVYQGLSYTKEEFVSLFEEMIASGTKALDQEILMFAFDSLISYFRDKRMYKKALALSEEARRIRSYGSLVI